MHKNTTKMHVRRHAEIIWFIYYFREDPWSFLTFLIVASVRSELADGGSAADVFKLLFKFFEKQLHIHRRRNRRFL